MMSVRPVLGNACIALDSVTGALRDKFEWVQKLAAMFRTGSCKLWYEELTTVLAERLSTP